MSEPLIPHAVLSQHVAVLGKTGSGKTYAAKGLVERCLRDKRQVCVLDPTGAWWGLRLGADGKKRGFDVVLLGGKHADIPLAPRSGAAVARLVTEQFASVVIDTSGMTVGEYTRWFIDFAGTLYTTLREPLHLVIDEAHYFAPQGKAPDVDAGRMIHACNRLMSGGRSLGIRGMMITQRPAKLHKDSLTCADTLIAMRVIAPQDRGAIKDWIDGAGDQVQGKAVLDSLAQLQRGEGWVWYPEGGFLKRIAFPSIETYDSSATPKHGAKAGPKVAEIKLDEVKAAMAEAVKEAEANDPAKLRARIADLERQLSKSANSPQVDRASIDKAVAAALKSVAKGYMDQIEKLSQQINRARTVLGLPAEPWSPPSPAPVPPSAVAARGPAPPREKRSPSPAIASGLGNADGLGKAERAILKAFYWLQHEAATQSKVGFYANYRAGSGTFNNALGRLRSAGLISAWVITDAGKAAAEALGVEAKPTGQELREWLRGNLGKAENALLDALCDAYPDRVDDDDLDTLSGYSAGSGTFNNALGRLRSIEAAEGYARSGGTKASDVFFN